MTTFDIHEKGYSAYSEQRGIIYSDNGQGILQAFDDKEDTYIKYLWKTIREQMLEEGKA